MHLLFRMLLKEQLGTLCEVDGQTLSSKSEEDLETNLTGFELMCQCQNEIREKMKGAYEDALR